MTWAAFRSSSKEYRSRPPSNCRAARRAWDLLAGEGDLRKLGLLGGAWFGWYVDGSSESVDAGLVTDNSVLIQAIRSRFSQGR